jgi:hypothetical protein
MRVRQQTPRFIWKDTMAQVSFSKYICINSGTPSLTIFAKNTESLKRICIDTPNIDGCKHLCSSAQYIGSFRRKYRFNEENELAKRYLKFNLQQLIRVAISACETCLDRKWSMGKS